LQVIYKRLLGMENLNLIYFSPTNTTQKIIRAVGLDLGIKQINEYNITTTDKYIPEIESSKNDLTIIAAPVYGGRVPLDVVKKLEKIQVDNAPVVLIVVYGNRAYEDSLLELKNIAHACGFRTIAAAAFIGEHSYSTNNIPIAEGRPDKNDFLKCREFSKKIKNKIIDLKNLNGLTELVVPGNYPYKERGIFKPLSPETDAANCTTCKICESVCPTNAIKVNTEVVTNKNVCIWCCACVKACPEDARFFKNPTIDRISEKLATLCKERREPCFFI